MTILFCAVAFAAGLAAGVYAEQKFDLYHGARALYGRARNRGRSR